MGAGFILNPVNNFWGDWNFFAKEQNFEIEADFRGLVLRSCRIFLEKLLLHSNSKI